MKIINVITLLLIALIIFISDSEARRGGGSRSSSSSSRSSRSSSRRSSTRRTTTRKVSGYYRPYGGYVLIAGTPYYDAHYGYYYDGYHTVNRTVVYGSEMSVGAMIATGVGVVCLIVVGLLIR